MVKTLEEFYLTKCGYWKTEFIFILDMLHFFQSVVNIIVDSSSLVN